MHTRPFLSLLACLGLAAVAVQVDAAVYTVGNDTGGSCTHSTIQAAIDAAASTPEADEIHVDIAHEYAGPLRIFGGDLVLAGGYADCGAAVPTGRSVVRGTLGEIVAVLNIDNGACAAAPPPKVRVEGLDISDGPEHGVLISGCVDAQLSRMRIHGNSASYGAGVGVSGLGTDHTRVRIGDDVRIEGNTAIRAGGGLYVYAASLRIGGMDTVVRGNQVSDVDGYGGGMVLVGADAPFQANASILSGGAEGDGIVSRNSATHAAGLYAAGNTVVEAYTTDIGHPLRFNDNTASTTRGLGGAIRLDGSEVHMLMVEGVIDDNSAARGAAIALNEGAQFTMQALSAQHPADAVACVPITACNRVSGNAVPAEWVRGAVLAISAEGSGATTRARFASIRISGNTGESLFAETCNGAACPPSEIVIVNSLLAGNSTTRHLSAPGTALFHCDLCTIAGSVGSDQPLLRANGTIRLERSIVWEPGRAILDNPAPAALSGFSLQLHDRSDFPSADFPPEADIETGDPRFADATAGDYRPGTDSPVLDRAWTTSAPDFDLDRHPRAVDQPGVPDRLGIVDLGAFERPYDNAGDLIFAAGFE